MMPVIPPEVSPLGIRTPTVENALMQQAASNMTKSFKKVFIFFFVKVFSFQYLIFSRTIFLLPFIILHLTALRLHVRFLL